MARALLTGAAAVFLLLVPESASAQRDVSGRPLLPDQFFGLMLRLSAGGFVGEGAERVANPAWGYGGSLQVRVLENLYVDLSGDSQAPFTASAPEGGFLMTLDRQTIGLRGRIDAGLGANFVVGAGGGGARALLVTQKKAFSGGAGYVFAGYEWEVSGTESSASYMGVEAVYHHYFMSADSPFNGGMPEVRATFSYYFGGDDASDCW